MTDPAFRSAQFNWDYMEPEEDTEEDEESGELDDLYEPEIWER